MEQQEYFMRVQMLGQEAEKIEQQIQAMDQQISELNAVKQSLEALYSGQNKEILANLGKGIFVKAEIKSKDLFVNVGKEVIVKKSITDTLKVIDDQNTKMLSGKEEFIVRIQEIQEQMQELIEASQGSKTKGHACENEDCECEEECEDCSCKHKH